MCCLGDQHLKVVWHIWTCYYNSTQNWKRKSWPHKQCQVGMPWIIPRPPLEERCNESKYSKCKINSGTSKLNSTVASALIISEKDDQKLTKYLWSWLVSFSSWKAQEVPGQRLPKHCNSTCMILCQSFRDKLDKECLHSVVVGNADGDRSWVFNIWRFPSKGQQIIWRWREPHATTCIGRKVTFLLFFLLCHLSVSWKEMEWRPKKSGGVYVRNCLWRCSATAVVCAVKICVVKIQSLQ